MDIRRRALLSKTLHEGGSNEETSIINNYLTIEALEDGLTAKLSTNACEYCIDGDGNWKSLAAGTATESINTGQTLSFRAELTPTSSKGIGTFTISKKCNLKGNCMSMLFGDESTDNYSLTDKDCAFYKLFQNCTNIINVISNFLPATTLTRNCYYYMFNGCTNLTTAPELPATTLATDCYGGMFRNCTSLTTAPALPATELASYCYGGMFQGCTNLTTAPELLATTLADNCYYCMFNGCTSLTVVPVVLPATTLADRCYGGMFRNCTSLTTAPELPATTLARNCYYYMFNGCTSLNYIKMLATDISANYCLRGWVGSVASSGTFVKNPAMTSLPEGTSGIPSGWTVVNNGEESGGKIVNKITFKNFYTIGPEVYAKLYCDFTPTSAVDINFYSVSGNNTGSTFVSPTHHLDGVGISLGVTLDAPFTADWTPKEDDTYIYEVVLEQ